MAKTGLWLFGAGGRLAGATIYSKANGQTIIRHNTTPRNPQTEAQQVQRAVMTTVTAAYVLMKSVCNHCIEGFVEGYSTMQRFKQLNNHLLREQVNSALAQGRALADIHAFAKLGVAYFVPNRYILSAGSLPAVRATVSPTGRQGAVALADNSYEALIDGYRLKRGDQLTFLMVKGSDYGRLTFHSARVVLDPVDAAGNRLPLDTALVADGAVNSPNPQNDGRFATLAYDTSEARLFFSLADATATVQGVAVIVSRLSEGDWLHSATTLETNEGTASTFPSLQQAITR